MMVISILIIILSLGWLLRETDYLRVKLLVGTDIKLPELKCLSWHECVVKYGNHTLSPGVDKPLCGWEWLENNTHPIPEVHVSFNSGGVRYNWNIKDCRILKDAITATHAKPKPYKPTKLKRNKYGGLVAPLPAK